MIPNVKRALVLGGGVSGLGAAEALRACGAEVTVAETKGAPADVRIMSGGA